MKKIGLIIEGGGMRGIYSAGVLDCFLENDINFDYVCGVSSGSANAASYLAKQLKRNYRFYYEYGQDKDFLGIKPYIEKKQFFGLDYIYSTITNSHGKDPLDYEALMNNPAEYEIVATNAKTGKPKYFNKHDMSLDNYDVLKASSCIPIICNPILIDGEEYYDGGVSDPLPIQRAYDQGCDFVVVVLVKPYKPNKEYKTKHDTFYRLALKEYPIIKAKIERCDELEDLQTALAFQYEKLGKALVIGPKESYQVSTATTDKKILDNYYHIGYQDAYYFVDDIKALYNSK